MSRLPESSFLGVASTSQEGLEEEAPNLPGKRTLRITLLSSEWQSTKGGLSTINRELAIQLAKHPHVDISVYLPQCSEDDKRVAATHNVHLIEAEEMPGYDPVDWLATVPNHHVMDCVIGHGVHLGRQVPHIRRLHDNCKWIQVVHTAPEELGMFKSYANAISKGQKKHQVEIELCKRADQVVAIGPKLAEAFSGYLRSCRKDQDVLNVTPSIFTEFSHVRQASEEGRTFSVLVFGRGDGEDFQLKGYDIAAKAIAELKDNPQPYKLVFVGAPSGEEENVAEILLQQGISRNQLTVRCFNESREQLAELFCEVDLAIMPSRTEGFGLVALEALSAGLPILVSGNSGLGEALKNVPYGAHCLVDSEDPKEWAKAIRTVRQKRRDLRLRESKIIREEYAKMYSWEEQCGLLVERMMNLTAGPSEVSQLSAVDCSHSALPTTSQTELRSTTEGLPEESRPPLAEKSKRLLSPTGKQPSKRRRQELTDYYEQGFSGAYQSSVVDRSQPVFPAASQAHLRSGSEGFPGHSQSSVVDHSQLVFPAASQAHLRSESEDFSNTCQYSVPDRSQPAFPAASQAHLRSGFEGFFGGSQSSIVDRSQPVFPAAARAHLTSGSQGQDDTLARILQAEYNRRSLLKPLLWANTIKLPLDDVFTRLKIVSRSKTNFRLQSERGLDMYNAFYPCARVHSPLLQREGSKPNMYDIFNTLPKGADSTVLVEGSPGGGKTTFCLKIASDWANKEISKNSFTGRFEIVLLLKCRDIDGDIMEAISEQLLPEDEEIKKELTDYMEDIHNQENILIILDGLDELPAKAEKAVDRLLHRRIFPFCFILATSRQERGIEVRQNIDFGILLQIEGYTEDNAFEYIRKHFRLLGPDHLSKGERLIQSIEKNSFLHALRSNPLNLLLLCVVCEDYEGDLPSGRTELYQIIVRCILRRFCAKHGFKVPDDDDALEKQFEDTLLALGELAWTCLMEGRFCFYERELETFEKINKNLVARRVGLVFKEASLNRLKPQHEYHFFHKTFQEYLAACYLVLKLLRDKINVFSKFKLQFLKHIVVKYREVFLFVSGILGEEARLLFKQIGERLQSTNWDWRDCREEEATFFIESFIESGSAEQMAMIVCSFIPFPKTVDIVLLREHHRPWKGFLMVAKECTRFSQLQHPGVITVSYSDPEKDSELNSVVDYVVSCPQLKSFSFSAVKVRKRQAIALRRGLSLNSSLSSFKLRSVQSIPSNLAVIIGNGLAASRTLETVTFELAGEWGIAWASALQKGLSADTALKSVVLKIYGSMSDTTIQALEGVLGNTSLISLVIIMYGEVQDSLATSIGVGLASQTVLKSFALIVYGRLSQLGVHSLEKGFLQNGSLDSLEVKVFGGLPDHWAPLVRNVLSAKKSMSLLTFHPNIRGNVTEVKVASLCPVLSKNRLKLEQSLNVWGELSPSGAECLGKLLRDFSLYLRTVNIHGRITDQVANSLTSDLKLRKSPSYLTINIFGELTNHGKTAFQGLAGSENHRVFEVNVHELTADNCPDGFDFCIDDPLLLPSVFTKFNDSRTGKLSLTIAGMSEDWAQGLGDGLTNSSSLTTLALTVQNDRGKSGDWMQGFVDGLARSTSLTSLNLAVNKGGDWLRSLWDSLKTNTSLTTLTLAVNNYSHKSGDWMHNLGCGLAKTTSLTTLVLTVNSYSVVRGDWMTRLGVGLAKNTSLTSLTLKVNKGGDWMSRLGDSLAKNSTLTTLTLIVNKSGNWMRSLRACLAQSKSLITLTLAVNYYSDKSGAWVLGLNDGLAQSTSLATLTLAINNYSETREGFVLELGCGLAKNKSLTKLTIAINNYGVINGDWMPSMSYGFAGNTSLTTLVLTFNNYSDKSGVPLKELGVGVAKSRSLSSLVLTINSCSEIGKERLLELCNSLAKSESLTTLRLTVNDHSDTSRGFGFDVSKCFEHCKSLTRLSLTSNLYGEPVVGQKLPL